MVMDQQEFYSLFTEFLLKLRQDRELPQPEPDTHLWQAGYLDSFAMLEAVSYIEDVVGHDIELRGDFLPNFYTMRGMYNSYIGGSAGAPAPEPS